MAQWREAHPTKTAYGCVLLTKLVNLDSLLSLGVCIRTQGVLIERNKVYWSFKPSSRTSVVEEVAWIEWIRYLLS